MSEHFSVIFEQLPGGSLLTSGLDLRVERLTWHSEGGPQLAELSALLDIQSMRDPFPAGLDGLLRSSVKIHNSSAEPVWWGFLSRIEVRHGGIFSAVDLDWLANRISVQYWQRQAELEWQGEKTFTPWAEDTRSIAQYGIKERVYFLNSLLAGQAEAARDAWLAKLSQPLNKAGALPLNHSSSGDQIGIRLVCRGWWETIGWRYAQLFDGYEGYVRAAQSSQPLGRIANTDALLAQGFQTTYGPWECAEAVVKLRPTGICSDGVTASLCADVSGSPNTAAPLAAQTVPASAIGGGTRWVRFVFPVPALIQANMPYWLVLQRSGALNSSQYYNVMREDNDPYPAGQLKNWNGSAWTAMIGGIAEINFYLVGCKGRRQRIEELLGANLGGQFMDGVRFQAEPQGYTLLWRDGTRTCLEELRDLLQTGDASGRRLMGEVCADRSPLIRSEPDESELEYLIALDGSIRELSGSPAGLSRPAAGRRALLAPGWLDRLVLIERAVWTPERGLRAEIEEDE